MKEMKRERTGVQKDFTWILLLGKPFFLAAEITHVCQTGKSKQGKAEKTYMHIKEIHFPSYTTTFKIGKGENDFENILYFKENILKLFF